MNVALCSQKEGALLILPSVLMRTQTFAHNARTSRLPGRRRTAGSLASLIPGKRRVESALLTRFGRWWWWWGAKKAPLWNPRVQREELIRIGSQARRLKGIQDRETPAVNVPVATSQEGTDDPRNKEMLSHTSNPAQKASETYYKV